MKPLSVWTHVLGSRRRFFPVFISVILSVSLICIMHSLVNVSLQTIRLEYVEPYRNASGIAAKSTSIDSSFVSQLEKAKGVERILPCVYSYTNVDSLVGGPVGTQVIALDQNGVHQAMQAWHLCLEEGRLPNPGTAEIVMHAMVARNKGLRVGDVLGSDVTPGEMLEGKYMVCGIANGVPVISIQSLEYELERRNILDNYSLGVLVLPQEGQLSLMNKAMEALNTDGLIKRSFETSYRQYAMDTSGIDRLLTAIDLVIVLIISVCASFLSYIHFLMRRKEYAILSIIGYTRDQEIGRAVGEIVLVNLLGFFSGIAISVVVGLILHISIFAPKGLSLSVLNIDTLMRCFCVPLFATIVSIIPIWKLIIEMNAVSILEGRG